MNETYSFADQASTQILSITTLSDEWHNRHIFHNFQSSIEEGIKQFIVDLSKLSIINSVGINLLLRILKKVQQVSGQLLLTNASAQVLHLLNITKLTNVFTIKNSVEEAMDTIENGVMA